MKKVLLILSLVLTILLTGCSSHDGYKNISVKKIKNSIESSNLLVQEYTSSDIIELDYFNDIQEEISEGFIIRANEKLSLEDIIVIKTDEPEKIYSTLENYKKDMIVAPFSEGSGPKDNAKIASNTIIEKKGNYVYLISAENAIEIESRILKLIER